MAAGYNCRVCGRSLAPFTSNTICNFCNGQFPGAMDSLLGLAPEAPVCTPEERVRRDLATDTMLQDMFFGPETDSGLQH